MTDNDFDCSVERHRKRLDLRREARELSKTTDALDWAKVFIKHVEFSPATATDEAAMTAWFAEAIFAGSDAQYRRQLASKHTLRQRVLSLFDITKLQRGLALVGRLLP